MSTLQLLIGFGLLLVGRRLYWLFVAAVGFLLGIRLIGGLFTAAPMWLQIAIGLLIGAAGAAAAVMIQRLGVTVAGFLAGMLIAVTLLDGFDLAASSALWIASIAAGVLGALLFNAMFDWALIGLSSLAGAVVIAQTLQPSQFLSMAMTAILFLIGFSVQGGFVRWRSRTAG